MDRSPDPAGGTTMTAHGLRCSTHTGTSETCGNPDVVAFAVALDAGDVDALLSNDGTAAPHPTFLGRCAKHADAIAASGRTPELYPETGGALGLVRITP